MPKPGFDVHEQSSKLSAEREQYVLSIKTEACRLLAIAWGLSCVTLTCLITSYIPHHIKVSLALRFLLCCVLRTCHKVTVTLSGTGAFGVRSLTARRLQKGCSNHCRRIGAQWLENSAEVDVAAPLDKCWDLWENQELIPNWMPWIDSVKVWLPAVLQS